MNIGELIESLRDYNTNAEIKVGLSVPDLFIGTAANLSISGDDVDPTKCSVVRVIASAPAKGHYEPE